jgi:hypothetical protein
MDSLYKYNILNDTWVSLGDRIPRFATEYIIGYPSAEIDERIYLIAGFLGSDEYHTKVMYLNKYPTNTYVGVNLSDYDWNYTGELRGTEDITLNITNFNKAISNCATDLCNISLYIGSETAGRLNWTINVSYPGFIQLDSNLVSTFLGNSSDFANVPIKLESIANGTVEISDVRADYLGGNDTIAVFAWYNGTYTLNSTINLINYYSDYTYNLPRNINYLEFIPRKSTAYNVTPYGQTPLTPFFNLTMTNYGGKNMNLSIKLSNISNCVNISINTNSTRQANYSNLSTTWFNIGTNLAYLNNTKLWLWADYNCNSSSWSLWQPDIYLRGCCIGCVCSEDLI